MQINESIRQRREIEKWESLKLLEWQTQNLAAMIANTVEDGKARKQLVEHAQSLSLTKPVDGGKSKRKKRVYRTVEGVEIDPVDLPNYSYDEIDHTEEERELIENARKKNAGRNLAGLAGSFTR